MCQYENKGYDELKKKSLPRALGVRNRGDVLLNYVPYYLENTKQPWQRQQGSVDPALVGVLPYHMPSLLDCTRIPGREYGRKAVEICPDGNLQVLKWAAILVGSSTDYLGTKERIEQAYVLKGLLDKAIKIDPKDSTLLHLRGRYAFGIANLSWLERKAASAFFATPPVATIDEALADFVACHTIRNDFIENNIYAARCYIAKKDIPNAVKFLQEAIALPVSDENEKALVEEAKALLKKHHK